MNTNVKLGLLLGASISALNLIGHFTELSYSFSGGMMLLIPVLGVSVFLYVRGMGEQREEEGQGFMTYGEAVKTGAIMTLVATLVITIQMVTLLAVDGEKMFDLQIAQQIELMEKLDLPDDQIDQLLADQERPSPLSQAGGAFFGGLLSGMVVVLIAGIFMKKAPPEDWNADATSDKDSGEEDSESNEY